MLYSFDTTRLHVATDKNFDTTKVREAVVQSRSCICLCECVVSAYLFVQLSARMVVDCGHCSV